MAFAFSPVSWYVNVTLLIMFTAGNLLLSQVLAAALFAMIKLLEILYGISDSGSLPKTYLSAIAVSTIFRIGFVTFLLSSYSATQGGRKYCLPDVRNLDQPDPAVGLCPVFLG